MIKWEADTFHPKKFWIGKVITFPQVPLCHSQSFFPQIPINFFPPRRSHKLFNKNPPKNFWNPRITQKSTQNCQTIPLNPTLRRAQHPHHASPGLRSDETWDLSQLRCWEAARRDWRPKKVVKTRNPKDFGEHWGRFF